jgi:DNA-binding response OmpR family regulator
MSTTLCAMQGEALPSAAPAAPSPLVYIVDDEVDVGDLIAMYLNARGCRTRVFRDSVAAFSAFTSGDERPTLLITDHAMARLDGLELVRRCKQLCPGLKTLVASGSLTDDVYGAAEVKPDAMLQKPFRRAELLDSVEALLGSGPGA